MGQQGTTFDVTFNNCKWEQGFRYCFNSTQGFGSVSFINCQLDSYFNNIQLYSQLGAKTLIMNHCTIRTDESHCVYASPWNNYYINDVVCLGAGKRAFDSRADSIYPFKSTFQIFTNCRNAPGAVATDKGYGLGNAPQWHLWGEGTPSVIVDSCNLAAGSWQGNYTITNSNIYNSGGGTVIYGTASLNNCTGEITAVNKMNITNSNIQVIAQDGADLTVSNSSISLYNKFKPSFFKATFSKSNIGEFDLSATNFKIKFDNCNFGNQYKAIRLFGGSKDDIQFIGNSYPIATY